MNQMTGLGGSSELKDVYVIKVQYDREARVYTATCDDIRGLVLEVESLDDLEAELLENVPILLGFDEGTENEVQRTPPLMWEVNTSSSALDTRAYA